MVHLADLPVDVSYDPEVFGRFSESIANFLGTARFLVWQTGIIVVWLALNIIPPEQRLFAKALKELKDTSILTIADAMNVIHFGVMIELLIENDRVGFSVNHTATRSSRLDISAKLLRLAKEVI